MGCLYRLCRIPQGTMRPPSNRNIQAPRHPPGLEYRVLFKYPFQDHGIVHIMIAFIRRISALYFFTGLYRPLYGSISAHLPSGSISALYFFTGLYRPLYGSISAHLPGGSISALYFFTGLYRPLYGSISAHLPGGLTRPDTGPNNFFTGPYIGPLRVHIGPFIRRVYTGPYRPLRGSISAFLFYGSISAIIFFTGLYRPIFVFLRV